MGCMYPTGDLDAQGCLITADRAVIGGEPCEDPRSRSSLYCATDELPKPLIAACSGEDEAFTHESGALMLSCNIGDETRAQLYQSTAVVEPKSKGSKSIMKARYA